MLGDGGVQVMQASVLSKTSRTQLGLAERDLSKHKQKGVKGTGVKVAACACTSCLILTTIVVSRRLAASGLT